MMSIRTFSLAILLVFTLAACGGTQVSTTLATVSPGAVAIADDVFQPVDSAVKVGDTVTWTNQGQHDHTVSTSDGGFKSDGVLKNGASYAHKFDAAGTFPYFCAIHSSMKGTITVTP